MTPTISDAGMAILAAAWRRRFLVLIPTVIFLLIAAGVNQFWPRSYSTTMLLMLQERGNNNPLRSTTDINRDLRVKAEEIEALLKSDRVLKSAVLDEFSGRAPPSAAVLDGEVAELRSLLFVKVVGSEFIEIEMRGASPTGLGSRLSAIATRFLEIVLARDDTLKTVSAFAMEQRRKTLEQANAALDTWRGRNYAPDVSAIAAAEAREMEAAAKLAMAERAVKEAAVASGLLVGPDAAIYSGQIGRAQIRTSSGGENDPAQSPPADAPALLIEARTAAQAEHDQAVAALKQLRAEVSERANRASDEKRRLEARVAEATTLLKSHVRHNEGPTGSAKPLGLVGAEYMRMVDEPRDPVSPTKSILKVILACIGAGIGLGIAMAAVAEQLDDRIHSASEIATLVGAPLLAGLPLVEKNAISAVQPSSVPIARATFTAANEVGAQEPAANFKRPQAVRLASGAAE